MLTLAAGPGRSGRMGLRGPFWDRHDSPCANRGTRLMRGWNEETEEEAELERTRQREALPW